MLMPRPLRLEYPGAIYMKEQLPPLSINGCDPNGACEVPLQFETLLVQLQSVKPLSTRPGGNKAQVNYPVAIRSKDK